MLLSVRARPANELALLCESALSHMCAWASHVQPFGGEARRVTDRKRRSDGVMWCECAEAVPSSLKRARPDFLPTMMADVLMMLWMSQFEVESWEVW